MAIRKSPYKVNAEGIDEAFVLPKTVEPEEPIPPAIKLRKASRSDGTAAEAPEVGQAAADSLPEEPGRRASEAGQEEQEGPVPRSRSGRRTTARTSARTTAKTAGRTSDKASAKASGKTAAGTSGKASDKISDKPSGRTARTSARTAGKTAGRTSGRTAARTLARTRTQDDLSEPVTMTMEGSLAFPDPLRSAARKAALAQTPAVPNENLDEHLDERQEQATDPRLARQKLLAEANRAYMSKARSVTRQQQDLSLADLHEYTPNRSERTGFRPGAPMSQPPRPDFDMFAAVAAVSEQLERDGRLEGAHEEPHDPVPASSRAGVRSRKAPQSAAGRASDSAREIVSQPAARTVPRSRAAKAAINALLAASARGQRPVEEAESWADESLRLSQPGRAEVLTERKSGRSRKDRTSRLAGLNESPLRAALRDAAVPFAAATEEPDDLQDDPKDDPKDELRDDLREAPPAQDTAALPTEPVQSAQSVQPAQAEQAALLHESPADAGDTALVPAEEASVAPADPACADRDSASEDTGPAEAEAEAGNEDLETSGCDAGEDTEAESDAEALEDAEGEPEAGSEGESDEDAGSDAGILEDAEDAPDDVSAEADEPEDAPEDAPEDNPEDVSDDEADDMPATVEVGEDASVLPAGALSVSCADPDAGLDPALDAGAIAEDEEVTGDICDVNPFGWGEDTTPPGKVRFLHFYTWSTLPTRLVSLRDSRGHFLAPGYFAAIQATRSSAPVLGALREAALRRKWHLCIQQLIVPVVYPAVVPFRYWQHCTNPFAHTMVTLHYLHKKVAEEEIRRHFAMALPPGQRFTLNGISTLLLQNSDVFRQFFSNPANKSCRGIIWRDKAGKIFGSKFPQPARLVNYAILNPDWIIDAQPVAGGTDLIGPRARKNPKTCMERLRRLLVMDDAGLRRAIASEERRARKASEQSEAALNAQSAEYQDLHDGMEYVLGGDVLSSVRSAPAADSDTAARRTTRTRKTTAGRTRA